MPHLFLEYAFALEPIIVPQLHPWFMNTKLFLLWFGELCVGEATSLYCKRGTYDRIPGSDRLSDLLGDALRLLAALPSCFAAGPQSLVAGIAVLVVLALVIEALFVTISSCFGVYATLLHPVERNCVAQ
eukprot:3006280-Amphidinium_carterae.1